MVNYVNCHATSTLVGDIAEVNAMKRVFTNSPGLVINGTKSMVKPRAIVEFVSPAGVVGTRAGGCSGDRGRGDNSSDRY